MQTLFFCCANYIFCCILLYFAIYIAYLCLNVIIRLLSGSIVGKLLKMEQKGVLILIAINADGIGFFLIYTLRIKNTRSCLRNFNRLFLISD